MRRRQRRRSRHAGSAARVAGHVGDQVLDGDQVEGAQVLGLGDELLRAAPAQDRRAVQQRSGDRRGRDAVDHRDILRPRSARRVGDDDARARRPAGERRSRRSAPGSPCRSARSRAPVRCDGTAPGPQASTAAADAARAQAAGDGRARRRRGAAGAGCPPRLGAATPLSLRPHARSWRDARPARAGHRRPAAIRSSTGRRRRTAALSRPSVTTSVRSAGASRTHPKRGRPRVTAG